MTIRHLLRHYLIAILLIFPALLIAQPWQTYDSPEEAGWSSEKLQVAWKYADEIGSAAFMIIQDGKVVDHHGDVSRRFMCHSVRKSLLTSLFGFYVDNGTIDLDLTLKELNIDDVHSLTDLEKTAKIRDMMKARSGIFHPAAYETEAMKKARPARGSHAPNTLWYYNNWDFNTLCHILTRFSKKDFFEDFEEKLARPLGMQDFRLEDTYYHLEPENSQYPAYPFRMSARDLARVGQLYLQEGQWKGEQILSADWIKEATKTYSFNTREKGRGYAYMWWTGIYGSDHPNYSMQGVGNQAVIVFPKDNVVMVNRTDTYLGHSVETDDLVRLTNMIWEAKAGDHKTSPSVSKWNVIPPDPPARPIMMTKAQMDAFIGTYHVNEIDIEILWKNNQLMVDTPFAGDFYVYPVNESTLMAQDAWNAITFSANGKGKFSKQVEWLRDPALIK